MITDLASNSGTNEINTAPGAPTTSNNQILSNQLNNRVTVSIQSNEEKAKENILREFLVMKQFYLENFI